MLHFALSRLPPEHYYPREAAVEGLGEISTGHLRTIRPYSHAPKSLEAFTIVKSRDLPSHHHRVTSALSGSMSEPCHACSAPPDIPTAHQSLQGPGADILGESLPTYPALGHRENDEAAKVRVRLPLSEPTAHHPLWLQRTTACKALPPRPCRSHSQLTLCLYMEKITRWLGLGLICWAWIPRAYSAPYAVLTAYQTLQGPVTSSLKQSHPAYPVLGHRRNFKAVRLRVRISGA